MKQIVLIDKDELNKHVAGAKLYCADRFVVRTQPPKDDIRYALPQDDDIKFSRKAGEAAKHIFNLKPIIPASTFSDSLLKMVTESGKKDSDVYKAAGVDRRHYSKIISKKDYQPSKDTCIAFALALELDITKAADLLSSAGYSLSHSIKRDLYIEYFISAQEYDLKMVNEVLLQLGEKPIK